MALVADVILPLAIRTSYSYRVPPRVADTIQPGVRVLVNFGKEKIYTGLVRRLYDEQHPESLRRLKLIEEVLDDSPLLKEIHFRLFDWTAYYYMCTPGEVMKAALPAGLKPESALRIALAEGVRWDALAADAKEFRLLEVLDQQPVLNLRETAQLWEINNPMPRLRNMEARGWLKLYHEVESRYKPRYKSYLKIADSLLEDEQRLQDALASLQKAPQQENLMLRVLSDYYQDKLSPKTETLKAIGASSGVAKALVEKRILDEEEIQIDRLALHGYTIKKKKITLTDDQVNALARIRDLLAEKAERPVLLHGVTGSGKTYVYLEIIKEAVARGKQVLYLLPEITLTKQIIDRLRAALGDRVGVYHSRFNDAERVEIWDKVRDGSYAVVVGVRSSIFLPFQDLGLIVVDEEHDGSFKQHEPAPRYNARDLAIAYAREWECPVVLGSATPAYESYLNAKKGKFGLVEMPRRAVATTMPTIDLVDMRVERAEKRVQGMFSQRLLNAIRVALERQEQVILFQNRRGYAPYLLCTNCGFVPECINCDIKLTYHKFRDHLRCHYCSHTEPHIQQCPQCAHYALRVVGVGTERIEERVRDHFPEAVVQRMDLDTTRGKLTYQHIINRLESRHIDILVGTQMVSKGLDFENVTLVGVINADAILTYPDFRAHERAYQLLTQVSGRAGRSHKQGRVVIQTHMPENAVLRAVESDRPFSTVFEHELYSRKELNYPPINRMIRVELIHRNRDFLMAEARRLEGLFRPVFGKSLLGPDFLLVPRVRNVYRMQFFLKIPKGTQSLQLRERIWKLVDDYYQRAEVKALRIVMDVDP